MREVVKKKSEWIWNIFKKYSQQDNDALIVGIESGEFSFSEDGGKFCGLTNWTYDDAIHWKGSNRKGPDLKIWIMVKSSALEICNWRYFWHIQKRDSNQRIGF